MSGAQMLQMPPRLDHGEEGDHRLRDVGQVGRHPVARLQALRAQVQRERGDLAPQFGPGQLALPALLVAADDGGKARRVRRLHVAQHLARVVELRALEPRAPGIVPSASTAGAGVGDCSSK